MAPQPGVPAPTPAPPSEAPTEEQTTARVNELVARSLPSWKAACWDTADPAARKPGRYAATLAFDAAGKLVMFGIMEYRGESDPAIAACLRKQEHPFSVPAPGRSPTYEVPFPLP